MRRATQKLRGARSASQRVKAMVGGGLLLAAGLVGAAAAPAAPRNLNPHAATVAALKDIEAAIAELQKAADSSAGGSAPFKKAAHRALNELVGKSDPRYQGDAGSDGDAAGALGHLDYVLHDSQSQPWVTPVTSAKVNVQAAVGGLHNALQDDELQDFMLDATDAMTRLDVAVGRASESDALGGLRGALANTVLGVPSHARVTSGCSAPPAVPAYGVRSGYVLYVAVPLGNGKAMLPENFYSSRLTVDGSRLIAHTAAAAMSDRLCRNAAATGSEVDASSVHTAQAGSDATGSGARADPANDPPDDPPKTADSTHGAKHKAARHSGGLPALYTEKQAEAGKQIFQKQCVTCHGDHLQGKSAPSVGGKDFLEVANRNGWTLDDLRNVIVYNMPFNNPGALSKEQYADVIAYLLAMNCYPAGEKPFPQDGSDKLAKLKVESPDKMHPTDTKLGLCTVN